VRDVLLDGETHLLTVPPEAMPELAGVAQKFGLDFDDAYQLHYRVPPGFNDREPGLRF
jgi:hypothetical protein